MLTIIDTLNKFEEFQTNQKSLPAPTLLTFFNLRISEKLKEDPDPSYLFAANKFRSLWIHIRNNA